jgi:hypothetical protein
VDRTLPPSDIDAATIRAALARMYADQSAAIEEEEAAA